MHRPVLVRHRLAMLFLITLAAGMLTACTQPTRVPVGSSSQASAPTSALTHDVVAFCAHVSAAPSDQCVTTARRLTGVLSARLKPLLPPDAVLTSNLREMSNPEGEREMAFLPRSREGDSTFFEATVRIRAVGRATNLDFIVGTYAEAPDKPVCPTKERLRDMTAKGSVQHRCDRTVEDDGTVLLVQDTSRPYGSDQWAQVMIRHASVVAYRKDGTMIDAGLEPIIERAKDPAEAQAASAAMLTLDQLLMLVHDKEFTLVG